MSTPWTTAQMPRLDGTRVIVTGATRGLGEATARGAAAAGAAVVVAGRKADAAARVAGSIGNGAVPAVLDLADRDSIRAFADSVDEVDVLIHNAGVLPTSRDITPDGWEASLATNVLGPFLLTNLLAPRIRGRVVAVNSTAHRGGRLDLDDLHFTHRRFTAAAAYSQSKLAQALWMLALDRRLRTAHVDLTTALAHPGWAATDITALPGVPALTPFILWLGNTVANSVVEGAACTLYAASMPIPSGSFVGPAGIGGLRGAPTLVGRSAAASDTALAEQFWATAAELTGSELTL